MLTKVTPNAGPIKAILWDMDGTLLDTETLSDVAIYEALGIDTKIREANHYKLPWDIGGSRIHRIGTTCGTNKKPFSIVIVPK